MCGESMSSAWRGFVEPTRLKRKPSLDLAPIQSLKRQLDTSTATTTRSSLLLEILREYGLLAAVVSNLCADDLLALALTAKALHKAIMPRSVSLENLLGRLRCSGKGIAIRNHCHRKSTFFYEYDCTEHVQCGSMTTQRTVETKPCATCKVATCDECRVHCVYQSIFEAPSDPDDAAELPNFSGFVMLKPHEHPILSPHHLVSELPEPSLACWQNPSTGHTGPYHDQGYLDAPLASDISAPPESIEDVLDLDLGEQSLMTFHEDSRYGCPSPALASLGEVSESRKIVLCDDCFQHDTPQDSARIKSDSMPPLPWLSQKARIAPHAPCHCTLRKRFIDRWLCLRCYQNEERIINVCAEPMLQGRIDLCRRCGADACHIICLWCWGEVVEDEDELEDSVIDDSARN